MPQAMEWSLATPITSPRFPFMSPGIGGYASSRLKMTDALVPPKPNEFDSTAPSLTSSLRARDRQVDKSGVEILDVGAFADEAVVHHQERVDRLLGAGGAERMPGQRLG